MVTAFRDGFQSVYGARVYTDDFIPAVEAAREAGIDHFEAGGGARFQSLYFYCNEDAFTMMDRFRAAAGPQADLQTLARGVNVVGLSSQSRDIINLHARLFRKHGITTIRNFDALNDVYNLIDSGKAIVDAGCRHEVCVTLMALPEGVSGAHDASFYVSTLKQILNADIPYDSVCFKDASGTSTPAVVYETVKSARKLLPKKVKIAFHSHDTAGVCVQQYRAALDAGVDQIDLAMAPVSGGTSQPDVMTMHHALRGTEYSLGIDPAKVFEAEEVFRDCMKDYFMPPEAQRVEPLIPLSPMPGGALTANTQMLRDNGLMDRYEDIIRNMKEVVIKGGFGTSVTPVSQFYFQQAFNNTMFGPWEKIADGYGKMVLGYFGRTPVRPDEEVVKIAAGQMGMEPTDKRVVDINDENPELGISAATAMLKGNGLEVTDENVFIAATCLEKGIQFLKGEARENVRKNKPVSSVSEGVTVRVNGKAYGVKIDGENAVVNGRSYGFTVTEGLEDVAATSGGSSGGAGASGGEARGTVPSGGIRQEVKAPMPGLVLRITATVGQTVARGDELLVLEAMKMEMPISAPESGTVESIDVNQGDQVKAGALLIGIS